MPKKVRSARGEIVDFDLMKIKQQLAEGPKPTNVAARQDFIDQKLRRRLKKVKTQLEGAKLRGHQKPAEKKTVDVDKKVNVQSPEQKEFIDDKKETQSAPAAKKTKRKIKKKTTSGDE